MLPAEPGRARRLAELLPDLEASLAGHARRLAPARSAVLVVLDGLGAEQLRARSGHARTLASRFGGKDVALSTFPTTTATALTSLMTATDAGAHGIVGYRALVPETGVVAGQLNGWEAAGLDPETWQRSEPVFARRGSAGAVVVSRPDYRTTPFTEAILRGGEFIGLSDPAARLAEAVRIAAERPGVIVYAYLSELDATGHRHGWESDRWLETLERVDAAVRDAERALPAHVGMLVTADHGMVDVPPEGHLRIEADGALREGIAAIGGEPRMLHLYTAPGDAAAVAERWRESESSRAWVMTRDEAIEAGLFGAVDPEVAPRIGDVLVAARKRIAYDDALGDEGAAHMIGQHGSLTSAERIVPLLRFGAYAS